MSEFDMRGQFVTLSGAPAMGKTTQAELLAGETGAVLLLGKESSQTKLASGETKTDGSDSKVERWFVEYHLGKLAGFSTMPPEGLVADMSLESDLVWARAQLGDDDLRDFESWFAARTHAAPKPDLTILLLLSPAAALRRVMARLADNPNRSFERSYTELLIAEVQEKFVEFSAELGERSVIVDLRETPELSRDEVHRRIVQKLIANA